MSTAYYEKIVQEDLDVGVSTATKRNPGGGTLSATQIGIHTIARNQAASSKTWTPGSVASGGDVSTTVTVSGAALGDFVLVSFSLDLQELGISASVTAANTVEVVLQNNTGAAVVLGEGTLKALVFQSA